VTNFVVTVLVPVAAPIDFAAASTVGYTVLAHFGRLVLRVVVSIIGTTGQVGGSFADTTDSDFDNLVMRISDPVGSCLDSCFTNSASRNFVAIHSDYRSFVTAPSNRFDSCPDNCCFDRKSLSFVSYPHV